MDNVLLNGYLKSKTDKNYVIDEETGKRKLVKKPEIARADDVVPYKESDAFKEKNGDIYEVSKEKRNEAEREREKSKKPNAYSKDATRSLIDDTPLSLGVRLADTDINLIPDVLVMAVGEGIRGSDGYNAARLRDFADMTDYTVTTPSGKEGIELAKGSAWNPSGVLGRAIKKLFGDKKYAKTVKKASQALKSLANDGFTAKEAENIFKKLGKFRKMKVSELNLQGVSEKSAKLLDETFSLMPSADDVVRQYIKLEEIPGKKFKYKVVKGSKDALTLAAPTALESGGAIAAVKELGTADNEKGIKIGEPMEYGVPIPFVDSVTEFFDKATKGTWRYNKREAIDFLNEAYDKITKNGDEETLVNFLKAYNDIDFNSKKSVVDGVKKINKMYKKNYSIDTSTKA